MYSFWFTLGQVMPPSQTTNVLCQGSASSASKLTLYPLKVNSYALSFAETMPTAHGSLYTLMTPEPVNCFLAVEALLIHCAHSALLDRENAQFQNLFAGFKDAAWVISATQKSTSVLKKSACQFVKHPTSAIGSPTLWKEKFVF